MKVVFWALLAGCIFDLLFFSCLSSKSLEFPNKREGYCDDSLYVTDLMFWAAEQPDKKWAIDSLKPALLKMEQLWSEYHDSAIWKVYTNSLFEVGFNHLSLMQFDSCYPYLNKCYEWCMSYKGERYILTTMCMNKLSFYFQHVGDLKKQKEYLFKSFDLRREILDSNDRYLAYAYANVAAYYREIGDYAKGWLYYDKSTEIHKKQFEIYEQTKNPANNKKLLHLQGSLNDFPKTIINQITNIPVTHAAILLGDANAAAKRKEFKLVEQRFKDVDEMFKKYPEVVQEIKVFIPRVRAEEAMQKGDFVSANKYLDTMIAYHRSVKSAESLLTDYFQKSFALSMMGRLDEAIDLASNYLSLDKSKPQAYLSRLSRLSQLYSEAGYFEKALLICDSAYQFILTKSQYDTLYLNGLIWSEYYPEIISKILYYLAIEINARIKMLKTKPDQPEILNLIDKFDMFNNGLVYLQERNFSQEGKISQEIKFYPLYENIMHLTVGTWKLGRDDKYFKLLLNWSDAHKSIELRNSLNLRSGLNLGNRSVINDLFDLQNEIERAKARIRKLESEGEPKDSIILVNLRSSLFELTADREVLLQRNKDDLDHLYNPTERMRFPLNEVTDYLKEGGSQLIDYFIGDEYLIGTLVNPQGKFCFSRNLTDADRNALESMNNLLGQKNGNNELHRIANTLYQLLLEPLEDKLTNGRLIVIPDGVLFKLPFELLEDKMGVSMIKKFSFQYEFSAKLLLKKSKVTARKAYSGFAPAYDGNETIRISPDRATALEDFYDESRSTLGALRFNMPEVREGAEIMDGDSYTGAVVDKNMFKEKAKDAKIVHLAMHALTDDQNPDFSQLIFKSGSVNEPMFAYELNGWSLNAELAILSACNTGVGKYIRGNGMQSMARAFKSAGCKNIVMSLWPANDASTKEIVVGFLGNLKSGMGKADALRKAKLDYLAAATPDTKLPYYWAGLVLIGDNEIMSFPSPWRTGIFSFVTVFLLVSITWLAVNRINRKKIQ